MRHIRMAFGRRLLHGGSMPTGLSSWMMMACSLSRTTWKNFGVWYVGSVMGYCWTRAISDLCEWGFHKEMHDNIVPYNIEVEELWSNAKFRVTVIDNHAADGVNKFVLETSVSWHPRVVTSVQSAWIWVPEPTVITSVKVYNTDSTAHAWLKQKGCIAPSTSQTW